MNGRPSGAQMILTGVIAGILTTLALRFIDRKFTEMEQQESQDKTASTTSALAPFFTIAGV